jgi:hypothetical protein
VLIRDLPEARSRVATPGIVPFWAADYHKYFFFSAVNSTCGPSVTAGRLNGFAISRIRPRSVTLCARAFDSRDRVDALAAVVAVREGQLLDRSKVQSMTLLHEGVHVVLPPGGSPDTACMFYPFSSSSLELYMILITLLFLHLSHICHFFFHYRFYYDLSFKGRMICHPVTLPSPCPNSPTLPPPPGSSFCT